MISERNIITSEGEMKMFLLMQALAVSTPSAPVELPILTIVVDAGHGGSSLGRVVEFMHNGKMRKLTEKAHTCNVAAWLIRMILETDWNLNSTTLGECLEEPRHESLLDTRLSPYDRQYRTNQRPVRKGRSGLRELLKSIPLSEAAQDTILVSIHFDYANTTVDSGAFIIVPGKRIPRLAKLLEKEFAQQGLKREFCPETRASIVTNNECFLDDLLILNESPLCQTVLIELGNMRNPRDRELMLRPGSSEYYARIIFRALLAYARNPERCAE